MKRTIIAIALCAALGTMLCGCSSDPASNNNSQAQESAQVTENKKDVEETPISLGQTVTTDDYELTLESVEWTEEIREQISSNTSWTASAANNGGEVFLAIKGTFKNLGSDAYAFSAIGVTGTVNDKYKLEGSIKSNKSTVGPLSTESIYVVLPTSNEMKETFQIGMITLDVRATEPYGTSGYTHGDTIAKYTLAASA